MKDPLPIQPFAAPACGSIQLPGSKSITNRVLLMAALADRTVRLLRPLISRDSRLMLQALDALGFETRIAGDESWIEVEGRGGEIPRGYAELNVGNAGTVARFLTALLVHHPEARFHLDGDPPMRSRPMRGLLDSLGGLGASFTFHEKDWHFPFTVHTRGWKGEFLSVDASASSQMLSALLLSAARAPRPVEIRCGGTRPAFVELTIEMIRRAGVQVDGQVSEGLLRVTPGAYRFPEAGYEIEPDVTAASYFVALPLVVGGTIEIEGVGPGLMQGDARFMDVASAFGIRAEATAKGSRFSAGEVGAVPEVIDFETFSDTFLTLAAVAPLLPAPVTIRGIGHTRFQETDRVRAMATELKRLGQGIEEGEDWLRIHPDRDALRRLAVSGGVTIHTYEDHRVAMSFGILGCADVLGDGRPWLRIADPACCGKTFPRFFDVLAGLRPECDREGH